MGLELALANLGTTPAAQRVMVFRRLTLDAVNRVVTTLDGVAGKSLNVANALTPLAGEVEPDRVRELATRVTVQRLET